MAGTINIEDIRLAEKCSRGDEEARKELYMRYARSLYALCIRYVGDSELARDLMHDSFIRIFDTIGKYKPVGMGAIVMDNTVVPDGTIIAAGAVVPANQRLEPGIWAGIPAKKIKDGSEAVLAKAHANAEHYLHYKTWYEK